ncbi:hypothetical protein QBC39DRAFT_348943 [Podospora conica]|nr:hypothetical protein QBC39DRAFT_348943 [Schizothecium conicum]
MTGQTPSKPTYFIAPGWDLHANAIPLGSVIVHPTQPQVSLFTPQPQDLASPAIQITDNPQSTGKPPLHRDGITGLFGTFLDLHGLGDEASLQYDRHAVLSYSLTGIKTARFTPSVELKERALAPEGRVAQYLRAGDGPSRVFMVTGVKTVTGASVTTASGKGTAWRVVLSVGVEGGVVDEEAPVVFAFELEELTLDGEEKVLGEGGMVKERLDEVFGEDVLTVLEGVDEAEGVACTIVASSPTCVDLLTASSARIGRDASRSRPVQ